MLAVGTKVRLIHTGAKGKITQLLADDMVNVLLQFDEIEIPVFVEDLVTEEEYKTIYLDTDNTIGQPIMHSPKESYTQKVKPTGKHTGIQLAFDPDYDREGMVQRYQLFLLNDTIYDYLFNIKITYANSVPKKYHGKLDASSFYLLGEMLYDQLNDAPIYHVDCAQMTTAGTEGLQTTIIKIKPKQFFKKVRVAPLLNRPAHLYFLFHPTKKPVKLQKEDLKTYTQKNVRSRPSRKPNFTSYDMHDVHEFANFNIALDLHIESIAVDAYKLNSSEKMRLQLQHFDKYMDQAIRLGVDRVFIIHGLGKGKLKNAIASRLLAIPEVKTFKNEFHPKYGWGATEVIF